MTQDNQTKLKYDISVAGCQNPDGSDWISCDCCNMHLLSPICQELTHSGKRKYTTRQYILVGTDFNPITNPKESKQKIKKVRTKREEMSADRMVGILNEVLREPKQKRPMINFDIHLAVTTNGYILKTPEFTLNVEDKEDGELSSVEAIEQLLIRVMESIGYYPSKHDEYRIRVIIEKNNKEILRMKRFVDIFEPSLCQSIRFCSSSSLKQHREALTTATRNLWLHFGIDTQKVSGKKYFVGDFEMTKKFWNYYYSYHQKLFDHLRKSHRTDWGFWYLNYTPKCEKVL